MPFFPKKKFLIWKVFFFAAAITAFALPAFSQQVDTAWVRRYNGPGNGDDKAVAIAVDSGGNVYVIGSSFDSTTGYDFCTIKYLPNGDTAWVRRYNDPSNGNDVATSLDVDENGNVYVSGSSGTIKYDPQGSQLWIQTLRGNAIVSDVKGNAYVTGVNGTAKFGPQGNQLWISPFPGKAISVDKSYNVYVTGGGTVKIDSLGNQLWIQPFGGFAIGLDSNNNAYVAGNGMGKYDQQGNLLWLRDNIPGGPYGVGLLALTVDETGIVYVSGHFWDVEAWAWMTLQFDSQGNQIWAENYYGALSYDETPYSIAADSKGNVFVTGRDAGRSATVKYGNQGNLLWGQIYYGSAYPSQSNDIALDVQGNVYVCGFSTDSSTGKDFFTIKYSLKGDLNTDGVLSPVDLVLMLQCVFLNNTYCNFTLADVTCDGLLTLGDVIVLLNTVFLGAGPSPGCY